MKKLGYLVIATTLVLGMGITSCDDSDDNDNGVLTSLDSSKKLKDLTDEEAYDACVSASEALADLFDKETLCLIAGVMTSIEMGGNKQMCETMYEQCKNEELSDELDNLSPEEDCSEEDDDEESYEDCEATVGELDKCFSDMKKAYQNATDDLSCNTTDLKEPDEPASCKAIEEKCPGTFGDDDEDDYGDEYDNEYDNEYEYDEETF
jgi:hypothetical protein